MDSSATSARQLPAAVAAGAAEDEQAPDPEVAEILQYTDARPRTVATLSKPSSVVASKLSLEIFQRKVRR